jgi:outer membrane protein assembly factor BamB
VHALSRDGEVLWKDTSIGNVWHVTAADITGDGRPEVITTSAAGQVHVFSGEGAKLRNLPGPRGMYAWIVRAAPAAAGRPAVLFAGGSGRGGHNRSIGAMDADGSSLWVVDIPGQVVTMSAAPSGSWLAVGCEGGQVLVLSASDGSVAAHRNVRGQRPNLEWLQTDGGEILLIASGRELTAVNVGAE